MAPSAVADGVERGAVVATERVARLRARLAMRQRVGELALVAFELLVFVGDRRWRPGAARRPGTGRDRSRAPAPARRRRAPPSAASIAASVGAHGVERRRVDAAEAIERGALRRRRHQRLVRVLAVDVDERAAQLGQRRDGGEAPVEIGPRTAVAWHDPAHDDLVVGREHEATFDDRFGAAGAHHRAVGTPAEQQPDGLDDHGLARARLAGDRGEAGPEHERELGDDAEVGDGQFGEHRCRSLVVWSVSGR